MAQIFKPNANTIARLTIVGGLLLIAGITALLTYLYLSPWYTDVGIAKEQPIPFSHKHHVGELKIQCQYCHASVEKAATAGFPSTDTCMSCHSQVWTNSPLLEPARQSYLTGDPLVWNKLYDLPDFVYFNHSAHVAKGVGCSTCHGRIDQQHLASKAQELWMGWCLDCHRAPQKYVRPVEEVYNMEWTPGPDQLQVGSQLVAQYQIQVTNLTNCYICHR